MNRRFPAEKWIFQCDIFQPKVLKMSKLISKWLKFLIIIMRYTLIMQFFSSALRLLCTYTWLPRLQNTKYAVKKGEGGILAAVLGRTQRPNKRNNIFQDQENEKPRPLVNSHTWTLLMLMLTQRIVIHELSCLSKWNGQREPTTFSQVAAGKHEQGYPTLDAAPSGV